MMKNQERRARSDQKLSRWIRTKYEKEGDGSYKREERRKRKERHIIYQKEDSINILQEYPFNKEH